MTRPASSQANRSSSFLISLIATPTASGSLRLILTLAVGLVRIAEGGVDLSCYIAGTKLLVWMDDVTAIDPVRGSVSVVDAGGVDA